MPVAVEPCRTWPFSSVLAPCTLPNPDFCDRTGIGAVAVIAARIPKRVLGVNGGSKRAYLKRTDIIGVFGVELIGVDFIDCARITGLNLVSRQGTVRRIALFARPQAFNACRAVVCILGIDRFYRREKVQCDLDRFLQAFDNGSRCRDDFFAEIDSFCKEILWRSLSYPLLCNSVIAERLGRLGGYNLIQLVGSQSGSSKIRDIKFDGSCRNCGTALAVFKILERFFGADNRKFQL